MTSKLTHTHNANEPFYRPLTFRFPNYWLYLQCFDSVS